MAKKVVVKSVYSLANAEWIYNRFNPQVVLLLRNPYSICHSIHRKWPNARLKKLVDQPQLMKDVLDPYRDILSDAVTPYQILASRVGAYYRTVLDAAERNSEWIVIKHEDLCANPIVEYRSLFEQLGIEWNNETERFLMDSNQPKKADDVQHVYRLTTEEIDKWRNLLSSQEINEIRDMYELFQNGDYHGMADD